MKTGVGLVSCVAALAFAGCGSDTDSTGPISSGPAGKASERWSPTEKRAIGKAYRKGYAAGYADRQADVADPVDQVNPSDYLPERTYEPRGP